MRSGGKYGENRWITAIPSVTVVGVVNKENKYCEKLLSGMPLIRDLSGVLCIAVIHKPRQSPDELTLSWFKSPVEC